MPAVACTIDKTQYVQVEWEHMAFLSLCQRSPIASQATNIELSGYSCLSSVYTGGIEKFPMVKILRKFKKLVEFSHKFIVQENSEMTVNLILIL